MAASPLGSDRTRTARRTGGRALLILLSIGLVLSGRTVSAQTQRVRVLRGVSVAPEGDWTIIEIELNGEFRYVTHSPSQGQATLQIRLQPLERGDPNRALRTGGSLVWRARDLVGLVDVEADVDSAGNTQLTLHFNAPMRFEVSQTRDLERVRVAAQSAAPATQELPARERGPRPEGLRPEPEPEARSATRGDRIDQILEEARRAMTEGELGRAILLYTKALEDPDHPRAPEVKELLALAHQRNGQLAHARAEYEEYLESYPDAEGAPRVRQRLEALLTARGAQPRAERAAAESGFSHSFSGSIAQFYRSDILSSDATGTETSNAAVDTDLFLSSRHTRGSTSFRTNLAASYREDLIEELGLSEAMRVTSGFVEGRWGDDGVSVRLGRQSPSMGGVMGRFDGGVVGMPLSPWLRLNLASGFPVDFSESSRVDTDRLFYGASLEVPSFARYWDAQLFAVLQRLDATPDRSAVGGQLRFTHADGFGLLLADYDVGYRTLNTAMLIANWRLGERTTLNVLADVRKSPFLTTANALQGQSVLDLGELHDLFNPSEIRELALDRTATSQTFTLGAWHQLGGTWQVSGDVTLSNLSETPASGGVAAVEGTGNELFYALRATASNLLVEGSFTTFGARYVDGSTSDRYELSAGGRYPLVERVRIGPELVVERRLNETAADQLLLRPSLRLEYRRQPLSFEAEAGLRYVRADGSSSDESQYFFGVGYRYDF